MRFERSVDLDCVHARDAFREIAGEHAEARTDLEDDVVRVELRESVDHTENVLVDEEVLAQRFLRQDVHSEKHAVALASIWRASWFGSSFRASASASSVWMTYAGSLRLPRTGCGARYGASVSARIRSTGTSRALSRRSTAF